MTIRGLIWLAVLFAAAVGIALVGRSDLGHVIVIYPPYRLDFSVHLLVGAILAAFIVLYLIVRVVRGVVGVPARVSGFRARSRVSKSQAALRDALDNLYAGRFSRAEKAATAAANVRENRDSAGLIGALAAHRMRENERRDSWLATITAPQWQDAKLMTLAEMQLDGDQAQAAVATLEALETQGARRLRAQQIGLRAQKALENWGEVLRLVKSLQKRDAIAPAEAAKLSERAAAALLRERRHDGDALLACWESLPGTTRYAPRTADLAAELLIGLERFTDAQRIVETALAEHWDPRLITRYAQCGGGNPLPLIQRAETWQAAHPTDADLSFALGRLCIEQRLWGKAQSLLEQALTVADHPALRARIHRALARMQEGLGNQEKANLHYRESALALETTHP